MQGKNGENYKKTALTSIRFGLQRYFILKRGFNIIVDDAFKQSNQVFEAVVVQLKRQGFAKVDHHRPIKKDYLAKIYSSYDQSSPNPKSLQHLVWSNIMYQQLFKEEERTFAFTRNSRLQSELKRLDEKYVYQELDELDKNYRKNDEPFDSSGDGRMYEIANNPKLCPERAFELYLSNSIRR